MNPAPPVIRVCAKVFLPDRTPGVVGVGSALLALGPERPWVQPLLRLLPITALR